MDLLLYVVVPFVLIGAGVGCVYARARVASSKSQTLCTKWAAGMFGSAFIIWCVYVLAPFLQLLVIFAAVGWLARRIAIGGPPPGLAMAIRLARMTRRFG
ncbi:MAG: hypothetical protein U1D30_18495 [Planctomycetota bacterium]